SFGLKRIVYQHTFGQPHPEELTISDNELYIDLPPDKFRTAEIAGYNVKFKLLKQYYATGRVIYVDRYTNPLGKFYRDTDDGATRAYDEVVPQDVTFVVGDLAKFSELKGDHEYRMGIIDVEDKDTRDIVLKHEKLFDTHFTNIHTIAASPSVQKALDILKAGDIATLEGYLIYWETRLDSGRILNFKSALYAGETHKEQKYGGRSNVGKCKQLLLTRITFDGYTFE
ncbi:MAG: hypothetical protein IKZ02_06965, partial [Alphaproteobacteria bacterium]|nr:hypothetical protein [Alphaproteobacteria bacterium]